MTISVTAMGPLHSLTSLDPSGIEVGTAVPTVYLSPCYPLMLTSELFSLRTRQTWLMVTLDGALTGDWEVSSWPGRGTCQPWVSRWVALESEAAWASGRAARKGAGALCAAYGVACF